MSEFNTLDGEAPEVVGHRGASGYRPEHTLEAYRLAIELGADVIEPDVVVTKDGVLIARHENELGGTTDVADRSEFTDRETTKTIDGQEITGWFAEDFTLAEIKTLYARERIPEVRPDNTEYDDLYRIPTLDEVIELVRQEEARTGREIGIIPETKHPTFFAQEGTYLDGTLIRQDTSQLLVEALVKAGFTDPGRVTIQSFELGNLIELQKEIMPEAGIDLPLVQLLGGSYDLAFNFDPSKAALGADPSIYDELGLDLSVESAINEDLLSAEALQAMARVYAEAIGPYKDYIRPVTELETPVDGDGDGRAEIARQLTGETTSLVEDAHAAGLEVVPYTLRAEESFLSLTPQGEVETMTEEARALIEIGVDGIFTDNPDLGRGAVNQEFEARGWEGADWDAIAAEATRNFERTGNWYVSGIGFGDPDRDEVTDWNAVAAQVTANFAATGQWFV
ncbi:glycerophosphodiester phosphodiesterase family protein [Belnapia moabensis]|uniref:glycerophosphodiester phosphodiesterase family protein n=1 Tax=Belnapia moabensis TaxID=365533 RepID=UPI000693950F|nr:glycerophosphodiester phosphodiesterase family protein [Belnapia moabensis]